MAKLQLRFWQYADIKQVSVPTRQSQGGAVRGVLTRTSDFSDEYEN